MLVKNHVATIAERGCMSSRQVSMSVRKFAYGSNRATECWMFAAGAMMYMLEKSLANKKALQAWLKDPENSQRVVKHVTSQLGWNPVEGLLHMFKAWDRHVAPVGLSAMVPGGYQDACDQVIFPVLSAIAADLESLPSADAHPLSALAWRHSASNSLCTFALPSDIEHLTLVESTGPKILVLIGAEASLTPGSIRVCGKSMQRRAAVVFTHTLLGSPHFLFATVRNSEVGDPDFMYTYDSLSSSPSIPKLQHIPTLDTSLAEPMARPMSAMCAVLYVEEDQVDEASFQMSTLCLHQQAEQCVLQEKKHGQQHQQQGVPALTEAADAEADPV